MPVPGPQQYRPGQSRRPGTGWSDRLGHPLEPGTVTVVLDHHAILATNHAVPRVIFDHNVVRVDSVSRFDRLAQPPRQQEVRTPWTKNPSKHPTRPTMTGSKRPARSLSRPATRRPRGPAKTRNRNSSAERSPLCSGAATEPRASRYRLIPDHPVLQAVTQPETMRRPRHKRVEPGRKVAGAARYHRRRVDLVPNDLQRALRSSQLRRAVIPQHGVVPGGWHLRRAGSRRAKLPRCADVQPHRACGVAATGWRGVTLRPARESHSAAVRRADASPSPRNRHPRTELPESNGGCPTIPVYRLLLA
jgi:hypothetical protein